MIGIIAAGTEELTCHFQRYFIPEEERNDFVKLFNAYGMLGSKEKRMVSIDEGHASTGASIAASTESTNFIASL